MVDCLEGLERAMQLNWYSYDTFSSNNFEQMLDTGDLSWVVPGQIIAFASPQDVAMTPIFRNGMVCDLNTVTPSDLVQSFHAMRVACVIRLNSKLYDAQGFERQQIQVHEMEFPDGSCPKDEVIREFVSITDSFVSQGKAVAVHCRAGLGRTGTLIGLYIMHKYGFNAKSLIAWMRICRPGMVVGIQQ